jgi:ATP-dependent DNA helicase PIF1
LAKNYPPVQQLQLYLPDMHMVSFHQRKKIQHVLNKPGADESILTAYFDANRVHKKAQGILYRDFPEYFTWQSNGKFWQPRKYKTNGQVGRIVSAHPAEGEHYYLRVLLNHVAGATSYEHLTTVNGVMQSSFR